MATPQKPIYTNLRWGRSPLTEEDIDTSFLAVGASGSGKTLVIRTLMQTVLSDVGKGNGTHALVYDPKNDAMSILSAFVDRSRIKLFNPNDQRCVCWNTALDIESPLDCEHLAAALVPQKSRGNDFFDSATKAIIRNIAMSFNLSRLDWTLADLLRAVRSKEARKRILMRHPETEYIVETYLSEQRLEGEITASIDAVCGKFVPLASSYEKAKEKFSIRECMEEEMVAVLGIYERSRESIQALNSVLSSVYTQRVLDMPEYTKNRYWQFYDELGEAGPLTHLASFSKLARSKGGRLVISFQSLAGLQKETLYGREGAEDLLSNFGNRFIGRVEDPTTARWLSDYVGEQDVEQVSRTTSYGKGNSSSTTRSKQNQRTLLPSEFMLIPACSMKSGLTGLFKLRSTVPYWDHIDGPKLFGQTILPPAQGVTGFINREIADQYLRPWSALQARQFAPEVHIDVEKSNKFSQQHDETEELQVDFITDIGPDIDLTEFRS